jgi:hypothetical protein
MSSARPPRFWHRLAFRLTVWYGGVLAVSAVACFTFFYWLMVSVMGANTDSDMLLYAQFVAQALETNGPAVLQSQINAEATSIGVDDIFFRVLDREGRQMAISDVSSWEASDVGRIEAAITSKTRAIMPVHLMGKPAEMDAIMALAQKYNLVVVEDAAHALGATYRGKPIGAVSRFTCFSFQAIKHLTTGDGGALC